MSSGYIKLNRRFFQRKNLEIDNMSTLAESEGISYTTIHRYLRTNEDIRRFNGEVLYTILINGMGYTLEEAKELTIGELFDFVETKKEAVG